MKYFLIERKWHGFTSACTLRQQGIWQWRYCLMLLCQEICIGMFRHWFVKNEPPPLTWAEGHVLKYEELCRGICCVVRWYEKWIDKFVYCSDVAFSRKNDILSKYQHLKLFDNLELIGFWNYRWLKVLNWFQQLFGLLIYQQLW